MVRYKLKAGALIYVISVSIILFAFSGFFIIRYYNDILSIKNLIRKERLARNASSGMELLLVSDPSIVDHRTIDLFGDKEDTVVLSSIPWGLFHLNIVKAVIRDSYHPKVAISGYKANNKGTACIYVTDNGKPLYIAGNTNFVGRAFIPKSGIKKTRLVNGSFTVDNDISGKFSYSDNELPIADINISKLCLPGLKGDLWETAFLNDSVLSYFDDTIINVIAPNGELTIGNNAVINGPYIIKSKFQVSVLKAANIDQLLIIAPSVIVRSGFSGRLQIVANDSVIIEDNVSLNYPSSITIGQMEQHPSRPYIKIGTSKVSGGICLIGSESEEVNFEVGRNAQLEGAVYVNGVVSLKGSMHGAIYCNGFFFEEKGYTYDNTLSDAIISTRAIDTAYIMPTIFSSSGEQKVVQWLRQ